MSAYRFSLQAHQDMDEIVEYISRDNPDAADQWLSLVHEKCSLLSKHPRIGRNRSDLRNGLRSFAIGNYVIFYTPARRSIEVVRVLHGARDLPELFSLE